MKEHHLDLGPYTPGNRTQGIVLRGKQMSEITKNIIVDNEERNVTYTLYLTANGKKVYERESVIEGSRTYRPGAAPAQLKLIRGELHSEAEARQKFPGILDELIKPHHEMPGV